MDESDKVNVQSILELDKNYSINVELVERSKMVDEKIGITIVSSHGGDSLSMP